MVGVFFSTIVFQRIVQRHITLLHMRGESKVHRVIDLSSRPELLNEPHPDPQHPEPSASDTSAGAGPSGAPGAEAMSRGAGKAAAAGAGGKAVALPEV